MEEGKNFVPFFFLLSCRLLLFLLCFLSIGLMWFSVDSIEQAQASHLYSYRHGFRGFAAKLTDEQASQIARKFIALLQFIALF